MSEEQQKAQKTDDEVIDFSKYAAKVKGWFTKDKMTERHPEPHHPEHHEKKSDDEVSFDVKQVTSFTKKHARWLIPLVCILIAMSFSIYLRTMPLRLPIADDWATNTVSKYYHNQVESQISQQYPNLPAQNKGVLVEREWQKFYTQNKQQIDAQTAQLSTQYRNQFKDDQGTSYLLGIDPYYYYKQVVYVLQNGYPGTERRDGNAWDMKRLAPIGREQEWNMHNWFGAWLHRLVSIFAHVPVMTTFFFVGTIFSALTVIPGFFIGRIITKTNVGGFFTAMMLAISAFFVSRTTGESSDTDVYSVFFPVLIAWLFLESMEANSLKKKLLWTAVTGFATGLFAFAWTGWWYIATFLVATSVFHIFYLLLVHHQELKTIFHAAWLRTLLATTITYITTSMLFVTLFVSFGESWRILFGPSSFYNLKAVGVFSYWPNIRTTVAELNVIPLDRVIDQLDGRLYFALAIGGILLALLWKDKHGARDFRIPFLCALWLVASLYATTKGIRFVLQVTPVFSIAVGAFMGLAWRYSSDWVSQQLKIQRTLTKIVIFILLAFLLLTPFKSGHSQAFNSVPSMNDGWYNTLTKIKTEAPANATITSWWDFGHWFKAIADHPVTFDGGTQVGWGAHWVGKALLTNDERTTVGIVRMLNCGQNTAFEKLDKILNDTPQEIELIKEIILQKKSDAQKTLTQKYKLTLAQADEVLQYTHCDAPTDYFITSEDMVGKAGVWGHFGSWDFTKAVMYQKTRNLDRAAAVSYLTSAFNISEERAGQLHSEIQSTEADKWIAPWPGYLTTANCRVENTTLVCPVNMNQGTFTINIDMKTKDATINAGSQGIVHPNSFVYADRNGLWEKKFSEKLVGFSAVLLPSNDNFQLMIVDPAHAYSTFTKLFFFDGHGQKCFAKFDDVRQFTGGRVITWVMDYNCQQENKVYFQPKDEVQAAHILISTQSRTPEQALQIIEDLQKNITAQNFAEYAKKFSEDPGSKNNGGALGWFGKGAMVPEFEKTAFGLKKGEISDPVKTQFGYHLILLLEKRTT